MGYKDSPAQPQTSAGCPTAPLSPPPHPDLWNEALAAPPTSVWSVLLAGDTAPIVWSWDGALSPQPDSRAPRRGRSVPVGLLAADPGGLSLRTPAQQTPQPPAPVGMGPSAGLVCPGWRPRSGRMAGVDLAVGVCAGELRVEGAPGHFSLGKPCAVERVVRVVLASPLGLTREPDVWVGTSTRTMASGSRLWAGQQSSKRTPRGPGSCLDFLQAEGGHTWQRLGGIPGRDSELMGRSLLSGPVRRPMGMGVGPERGWVCAGSFLLGTSFQRPP